MIKHVLPTLWVFLLGLHSTFAQLQLPDIFTSDMVLQRDEPIQFWGKGIPNIPVIVRFSGENKKTAVGNDSIWSVQFGKRKANKIPQSVNISHGAEEIILSNILLGDVWLCIGQSNMEWPMMNEMHYGKERPHSDRPLLRFYNPTYAGKNVYNEVFGDSIVNRLNTEAFYQGNWQTSDQSSIGQMSAVGYYFGKKITESEGIPIGLINLAIGGAPIETFLDRKTLKNDLRFSEKVKGNWLTNAKLPVWIRERGKQNVGTLTNVSKDGSGPNHAFKPGFAFSAGIQPILLLAVKGVIWYQGESNAQERERVKEYGELQQLLVRDYRKQRKRLNMPFYWVQLSSIDTLHYKSQYWPEFRNVQRKLIHEIKHGGMAVSSDIGLKNNVHPTNKKDVGHRLARWALKDVYGNDIIPSGPLPDKTVFRDNTVTVSYRYGNGLATSDGQAVRGFSLDGKTQAEAHIKGDKIVIPALRKPEFIFYAWQPWTDANLVNSEKLPASTFKIQVE